MKKLCTPECILFILSKLHIIPKKADARTGYLLSWYRGGLEPIKMGQSGGLSLGGGLTTPTP